jgi:hypothetical protein
MSVKDRSLGPSEQVLLCTGACEIFWGTINLVASVTVWSNHNRYSMVVVGGRIR